MMMTKCCKLFSNRESCLPLNTLYNSIRPLLSHDLKLRKVSGRHQISSDGKHLFDGCVFGRPRPRGPVDRPAIEIPPRKRRRITYDGETDSSLDEDPLAIQGEAQVASDPDGNRQLILSADFEDDDEDDDEDFEPNIDEEDVEEEEEDGEDDDEEEGGKEDIANGSPKTNQNRAVAGDLDDDADTDEILGQVQNAGMRSEVQKLHEAFPEAPLLICEKILFSCDKDVGKAWDTLSQAFKPSIPRRAINIRPQDQDTLRPSNTRSNTKASFKTRKSSLIGHGTISDMNNDAGEPPPVDEEDPLLQHYDHHGLPKGSISNGKALTRMAKIVSLSHVERSDETSLPKSARKVSTSTNRSNRSVRFEEINSGTEGSHLLAQGDSDDSEDEDFDVESSIIEPDSSSDSSDESSGSNKGENKNDNEITSAEESDTSSSGSTSDSDSDSDFDSDSDQEPVEVSSRPMNLGEVVAREAPIPAKSPLKDQNIQQNGTVPPGQGKASTKSRNRRRRISNVLQRYKNNGILPAGTTVKEMEQLGLDRVRARNDYSQTETQLQIGDSPKTKRVAEDTAARAIEFEARRRQLLDSLTSGGIEVGTQSILESLTAAPLESDAKHAGMPERMPVPDATEAEMPLTPSIDKSTEHFEALAAECEAPSPFPAVAVTIVESSTIPSVGPIGSTATESVSRARRKIDLGAAGRLLFGALGVRAPKNKADHEKVRNDLIKDIKSSKIVPPAEARNIEIESPNADEDPEAWREVINLRAVECCHDGVELSPAPFPFVQRWDPQQQGSYSKQSGRGRKGKRGQRNQSQYYDDEQQSSKKRKRNRSSYESYDSNEQYAAVDAVEIEDSSRHEEPTEMECVKAPNTQTDYSDGVEGAVNHQIMKDVQEATTSQAMDEDDLPTLPEDLSILPTFIDDDVKPGMVIAFKQLILSEATKWQPQMSTYRTAVVIRDSANGSLELRLAKRDRERSERYHDAETGERIYGKFDMPMGDDQDNEDDGFLEVTINEIIEPKVVQLAPESLSTPASLPVVEHNKASTGADDSTTLGHANSTEMSKPAITEPQEPDEKINGHQDLHVGDYDSPSIRGGDLSADDPDEMLPLAVSEDTREEISVLIREAGFRTSIPSSVLRAQAQLPATPRSASEKGSYSPKFHGFESGPESSPSQSIQAISSPSHFNPTTPIAEDVNDTVGANGDALENTSITSNVHYPKLSFPSSLASQVSDRGRQPDYPAPGDDTLHQFDDIDSFLGVPEELPLNRNENLSAARSMSVNGNSPLDDIRSSPPEYFETHSSGGLPTLAEVFSTARSSIGPKLETQPWSSQKTDVKDAKKIEDSYNREMEALDAMLEETEDAENTTPKASRDRQRGQFPTSTASQKGSGSQFKIPPGSQQVDLTLSSDVELGAEKENVSDGSYDDDYDLPRGPGWVEKKTRSSTRRQTTGNSQVPSQRVTKTRTLRRKTMTKF